MRVLYTEGSWVAVRLLAEWRRRYGGVRYEYALLYAAGWTPPQVQRLSAFRARLRARMRA